jgi:hypothetical protein
MQPCAIATAAVCGIASATSQESASAKLFIAFARVVRTDASRQGVSRQWPGGCNTVLPVAISHTTIFASGPRPENVRV